MQMLLAFFTMLGVSNMSTAPSAALRTSAPVVAGRPASSHACRAVAAGAEAKLGFWSSFSR